MTKHLMLNAWTTRNRCLAIQQGNTASNRFRVSGMFRTYSLSGNKHTKLTFPISLPLFNMKKPVLALILASALALTAGCASVNRPKPVTGPLAKTQQFPGKNGSPVVEFTPPQGANWYETERTKHGLLVYGKKRIDPNNTFVAYAFVADNNRRISDTKEFLSFIKSERAKDKDTSRFNMISDTQSLDETRAGPCVKYQYKAQDMLLTQRMREPIFLAVKGYLCQHPSKPYLITIEYSERSKSPFDDATLVAEGEAFINSLVLNN